MERTEVKSSQLKSVGYDPKLQVLEIEFIGHLASKSIYQYFEVRPEVHKALMEAESIGRYFGQQIRGKFKFQKCEPEKAEGAANGN